MIYGCFMDDLWIRFMDDLRIFYGKFTDSLWMIDG